MPPQGADVSGPEAENEGNGKKNQAGRKKN
jgi:hypothetical protein